MLERYRTLGAMLALREFTVADLARYSGVKEATVRTILDRNREYCQQVGIVRSGKPGGRPVTYALRAGTEQDLIKVMRELEAVGATPPTAREPESEAKTAVPASIVAAEDILLRQLPLARDPAEREQLVKLAATDCQTVSQAAEDPQPEVAMHMRVTDLLLRLAQAEQYALRTSKLGGQPQKSLGLAGVPFASPEAAEEVRNLRLDLRRILAEMPEMKDKRLLPDLFDRVGASPFAPALQADDISPRVLLIDDGGKETADLAHFVKKVLPRNVMFSRLRAALWKPEFEDDLGNAERQEFRDQSPFTAYMMTVRAGDETGHEALSHAREAYGALRKFVVVGDRYDKDQCNEVNSLQGRYLISQGLQPRGLLGALGAAMTEPPTPLMHAHGTYAWVADQWRARR